MYTNLVAVPALGWSPSTPQIALVLALALALLAKAGMAARPGGGEVRVTLVLEGGGFQEVCFVLVA